MRKVTRSEAIDFRYEREAQPLPELDPWTDQLNKLLLANEGKAARERLTLIRLEDCAGAATWATMLCGVTPEG